MRVFVCLFLLFGCTSTATAQSIKVPIEKRGGHLFSQWILNDSIQTSVFLESGFPKIIFSSSFIEHSLAALNVKLEEPSEDIYVSFWSGKDKYKALYTINDTVSINGVRLNIDALVIDAASIPAWNGRDALFPIADLQKRVELNINEGYMRILDDDYDIPDSFISFNVNKDEFTKALYLSLSLKAFDTNGSIEEVSGNFQFDLGAGNAFTLNKNQPAVVDFFKSADRMALKDSTQLKGPKDVDLSVIMPAKIRFGNIDVDSSYIVGMKYRGSRSDLYVGNIGPSFFQNFIVIFDFENSTLYLKPASDKVKVVE